MSKIRLGIAGYGNLGKSLEEIAENSDEFQVEVVFSRRKIGNAKYASFEELHRFDLDVVALAMGSFNDIEKSAPQFAERFNTVDSFDDHAAIAAYKMRLNEAAQSTVAIASAGWDPGLLSLQRGIAYAAGCTPATFWGRGISQGHSNALRTVEGVIDGVEFTEPIEEALKAERQGVPTDKFARHRRICYVACNPCDRERVEQQIKSIPHYFEGYLTEVHFASPSDVAELKRQTQHSGAVVGKSDVAEIACTLKTPSNTRLTAVTMLAYAKAAVNMQKDGMRGAFDVFDIPMRYIADGNLI